VAYFKAANAFTPVMNGKQRSVSNPVEYVLQYDGYCAWAMTKKRKALTDPEVWKIVGGKPSLNYSMAAYEKWSKVIPGTIKKADKYWLQMNSAN